MNNRELQLEIVKVAKSYVNMQEIKGNLGWTSPEFEKKMVAVGWKATHAWCCYFAEMVWSQVYDNVGDYREKFDQLFSGSTTRTFRKFMEAGWNVGSVPVPGAVVIWCHVKDGRASWKGHAGIVTEVFDGFMRTVEGNTNGAGSREGEVVAEKERKYKRKVHNGLQLVGFIYPPQIVPFLPFKNKKEGDEFREWVCDYHKEVAKRLDLDRSGSWFNTFITLAYVELGEKYDNR